MGNKEGGNLNPKDRYIAEKMHESLKELAHENELSVKDILEVFNKIILASEFSDLNNIKLSQSDWTSLENIAAFLRYFAKLSTEICASTYPTDLKDEKNGNDNIYYKNTKKIFTYKFDEYHSIYYPVSETLNNSLGYAKKKFVLIKIICNNVIIH
ncbi:hypothetical protein GLOIN_2v1481856 [Rhizophagus irregularis DAOM 181602=DAOM 197198]|uniref:Uncharacterized protein n=1 Tax=Rhizophagus irregularis (strain DAOM 181602 / DAOM 197198 / MUCL 43194) TaxID=747089 RepID=A0A2P4PNL5_RHIID|nr:hypothetical protein GLOIN_2v1481856 [Rhizophagus irregularis DAOM 181602=DAOM 197198]POG66986.1 hypothetical protein GLOIN_2v1481856 [Rhizophagus irregularis DAOM 181602=DAOM 197198]|eukprot:XP_025173852.1 hypothetical protein GLOIN_2v1481856 [Rhizophagus irregularis DAOM 181602=DAOM 197198]